MWAVLPAKDAHAAKQRLCGLLAPEERRRLSLAMLGDVLAALAASTALAGIVVVTRDGDARTLARQFGARVLAEPAGSGHDAAVTLAARTLAAEGRRGLISLPADVPLVTAAEIGHLIDTHGAAPAVTAVPARDGRGTNALACSPPDAIACRYGGDSFVRHLAAARDLGIEPAVVRLPGLGLDIDHPRDLLSFLERPSATRAFAYLEESGVAARCRSAAAGMRAAE